MKKPHDIIRRISFILTGLSGAGKRDKCRTSMHGHIRPGDKVLFAGAGKGNDVFAAAEQGAYVTVVDASDTLLAVFRKKMRGKYFMNPIRVVHNDILKIDEFEQHDMVFANFYLNSFPGLAASRVMDHLTRLIRPGGFLMLGDFHPVAGGILACCSQAMYVSLLKVSQFLASKPGIHEVHNLGLMLQERGLEIEEIQYHRHLFVQRFYSILARKQNNTSKY